MLSVNDFKVLCNIVDKNNNKGLAKGRGTTLEEINQKLNSIHRNTINSCLKKLLKEELIEYGLKIRTSYTYVITEKGLKELKEMKGIK